MDAGSVMPALPSTDELTVFRPSDKGYVEPARIKVADLPTDAHPVIARSRFSVQDEEAVTIWTIESTLNQVGPGLTAYSPCLQRDIGSTMYNSTASRVMIAAV